MIILDKFNDETKIEGCNSLISFGRGKRGIGWCEESKLIRSNVKFYR
jgi:hypothetical protein